jgi:PAS domain S-box-containing protein
LNSRDRAIKLTSELAQHNAEIAHREREMLLLMDNVPAGVASFDAQSRLRRCNMRYAAIFAAHPKDIVGLPISAYVPKVALDQILPFWAKALGGEPQRYRRTNVDSQTGIETWLDVDVLPEFENAEVVGLFALLVDVSERVRTEREIRELNADLERRVAYRTTELELAMGRLNESREELVRSQAKAALSALVASVAHELSTPIGNSVLVASTFSDLSRQLQQQVESGQLRKSNLLDMCRNLDEGSLLLQRNLSRSETLLRNFKQVAADQASEQQRPFDLAEVIAEVVSSLGPSLRKSPHRVVQRIEAGIIMDSLPGPLGQVVINLINNAYMHAFEGRLDGVLAITASVQGEQVTLQFADNGVGIPQGVLLHLFEPFFSTKIGRGGTGLGMSIVDSIVRKVLGGAMQVQSVVGQGTTLEIRLPRVAPPLKGA